MRSKATIGRTLAALVPIATAAFAITMPVDAQVVPAQVLVRFKPGATQWDKDSAIQAIRGQVKKALRLADDLTDDETTYVLTSDGLTSQVITYLRTLPSVAVAEPDGVCVKDGRPGGGGTTTPTYVANDPYFTNKSLWSMYGDAGSPTNAYGSQVTEAWIAGHRGSSTSVVAMIDGGVDISHPDLNANIWRNPGEIAGNGVDDDGNGYVDDISGWDFANNDKTVYDSGDDGHGTHVAGSLGAVGNNGIGVAGMCWQVKIIPCKFLTSTGGSTSNAVAAINYLIDLKQRYGLKITAVNNSWGTGSYSQTLHDAVIRAAKAGILDGHHGTLPRLFEYDRRHQHGDGSLLRWSRFGGLEQRLRREIQLLQLRQNHV
jgi:subtilisin family serine protease